MLGINKVVITPSILRQISEIDEFKGLWRGLERHTTGLQLLGEVSDHGAQLAQVLGPLEHKHLDFDVIEFINRAARRLPKDYSVKRMNDAPIVFTHKGEEIGALSVAEKEMAFDLTEKLLGWVNDEIGKGEMHPLIIAAVFMSVFLQAAPCQDKNLDTAIFMVVLILLKTGYNYAPYVFLNALIDEKMAMIYKALLHNQDSLEIGAPRWEQWLAAFLTILQDQKDILYKRLYSREEQIRHLPKLSAKIMALFRYHQRLQMAQIVKLTQSKRATVKLRLSELVEMGVLKRHGAGRSTWYALV